MATSDLVKLVAIRQQMEEVQELLAVHSDLNDWAQDVLSKGGRLESAVAHGPAEKRETVTILMRDGNGLHQFEYSIVEGRPLGGFFFGVL